MIAHKLSHHKIIKQKEAFSLIEVIVFMTLVSIVLISAVGFTMRLVHNMSYNQHKLYATHYVQDLKEWLDGEREADWQAFQSYSSQAGTTYCANNALAITDTLASLSTGTCPFTGVGTQDPRVFRRTLILTKDVAGTATRVTALLEVAWMEDGVQQTESITTVYSLWQ
ncbi:hypothetical protein IPM65_05505 [Candidatus Roizmanbacteria bacterium]|nr:MAG: hypothetical protein IPM65_05505 [Candidatus Roizmanbacteria bacterium]